MFRLLRFFSVTSLVLFALVIVTLALFYRRTAVEDVMRLEEDKNVVLTKMFANTLWPLFSPFLLSADTLPPDQLREHPETARLRQAIIDLTSGLQVVKVKIYSLDGQTVFSSDPVQIGELQDKNPGVLAAKVGDIESELTHRSQLNSFDGVIEDREVLASYVPVRRSVDGPVEAVIELYTDVTYLLSEINLAQGRVVLVVSAVLAALYAVLLLLVRHAERVMEHQYLDRNRAENDLRRRVQIEQMVAGLSTRFVGLAPGDIPAGLNQAVANIGSAFGVDLCTVVSDDLASGEACCVYRWNSSHFTHSASIAPILSSKRFPWLLAQLGKFEALAITHLDVLPPAAQADRLLLEELGIRSVLVHPLKNENQVGGFVMMASTQAVREWTPDVIDAVAILADMLATVLARKQAEDALHRSERRFESLVGSMDDVVFTVDNEGRYSGFFGRSLTNYDVAVPDVLGKLPSDIMPTEVAVVHENATAKALAGQSAIFDWTLARSNAPVVYFQTSLSPLRDDTGAVIGLVGVSRDITDLKRLELVKTEFIANVSHELRTPMASIVGYTELLLRGRPGPLTPTQHEFLETVRRSSERLKLLVDELLDVSHIDAGRFQMRLERVQLATLIKRAEERFRPIAAQATVQLAIVMPEDPPDLRGDANRLNQVLDNLLSNAIKFTHLGGVVQVTVTFAQDNVRIDVSDTGIGIPPSDLPNLFTRFYRAGNVRSEEMGGAGLGLYIVQMIVEGHHGRIEVHSELGVGTVFSVWLPIYQIAPMEVSAETLAQEIAERFFDAYTA